MRSLIRFLLSFPIFYLQFFLDIVKHAFELSSQTFQRKFIARSSNVILFPMISFARLYNNLIVLSSRSPAFQSDKVSFFLLIKRKFKSNLWVEMVAREYCFLIMA
ncbi:hypothetical protein BDF21DRAFT_411564 [Thamnidium elegans]|nr:hypothetical protein BDF21DRAFT_411564 [Thamnidium elegans]